MSASPQFGVHLPETTTFRLESHDAYQDQDPTERGGLSEAKALLIVRGESTSLEEPSTQSWPFKKVLGWRFGVACSTLGVGMVLLVNITFAVVFATRFGDDMSSGIGTVYKGSCDKAKSWSTGIHLVINVLSSLMLAGSSYTMQCLSSPTREEIDRAHAKGEHLDVGILSARNIFGGVSKKRAIVWWLLAISSMPVHLLFNSVIFNTDADFLYDIVVAPRRFLTDNDIRQQECVNGWNQETTFSVTPDISYLRYLQQYYTSDQVEELSVEDCLRVFEKRYVTDRRQLLLVSTNIDQEWNNISIAGLRRSHMAYYNGENDWPSTGDVWSSGVWDPVHCAYTARGWPLPKAKPPADNLTLALPQHLGFGDGNSCLNIGDTCPVWRVQSCITSKPLPGECRLQYALPLLIAVIVCNMIKFAAMLWTLVSNRQPSVVTFGDAVSSFLQRPDHHTLGQCLQSSPPQRHGDRVHMPWTPTRRHPRIFNVVGSGRWVFTLIPCLVTIVSSAILLKLGADSMAYAKEGSIFASGIGHSGAADVTVQLGKDATGTLGLIRVILLVNTPQLIISFLYFAVNGLWTSMLLASEWSSYYHLRKKALRTSYPEGKQRSTYWLQLPLRYSVPLLIASTLLHWMISQSIFLVRIAQFDSLGQPLSNNSDQVSAAGYSTLALFIALLMGLTILVITICFGIFTRLNSPMPIVRSSSLAIAAACHPPDDDLNAALFQLSWGDVSRDTADVGHCTFTSKSVRALQPGRLYE